MKLIYSYIYEEANAYNATKQALRDLVGVEYIAYEDCYATKIDTEWITHYFLICPTQEENREGVSKIGFRNPLYLLLTYNADGEFLYQFEDKEEWNTQLMVATKMFMEFEPK